MNSILPTDQPPSPPALRPPRPRPCPTRAASRPRLLGWLASLLLVARAAESPVLSLAGNGTLNFQPVPGHTHYTVEWAPTVNGPWNASWTGLQDLVPSGPSMSVPIPMFFRVVALGQAIPVPPGMAHVEPGEFLMGDPQGLAATALPVRAVRLDAFFIERLEVSQSLWDEVRTWGLSHGYEFSSSGHATATTHPISNISWHDAIKWCNARSERDGLSPAYFTDATRSAPYRTGQLDLDNASVDWSASGHRLPTEAEWEKAARAGLEAHHYPWSSPGPWDAILVTGAHANYWNSGDRFDNGTTPAGYYDGHQAVHGQDMANGYGLYDMAGNVSEMCWDRSGTYDPAEVLNPHGPDTGTTRVQRGGSWYDHPATLRCAARQSFAPGSPGPHRGFRCVRRVP